MIQVVQRALDILEFVARHGKEPVQLVKIAEHVGLSQPTAANIIKTLAERNYLEQMGRKVGYRLGMAAYQLSGNDTYDQHLIAPAVEPMRQLRDQLNETALLAVIRNNKRFILHTEECEQMLTVKAPQITEVYNASTGRLLMAYLSPKELDSLLKVVGLPSKKIWPGAETKEGLLNALQKIREEEFAELRSIYHTVGFAVPVYRDGKVVAGLSVFVPESRYSETSRGKLYKAIRKTARKISDTMSA